MKRLWIKCLQLKCNRDLQMHAFLFINIIFWMITGFLVSSLSCFFFGITLKEGIEQIFVVTGYAGVVMGWFGGLFFLMKQ